MNRDEARFLLAAVRPGEVDRSDPKIAEAMQLLADDPELQAWFEKSNRFDQAMSDRLAEVAPPEGLRDSILTGMEASGAAHFGRRRAVLFSLAAVLAVAGFLTWLLSGPGIDQGPEEQIADVSHFERAMGGVLSELQGLDVHSSDPQELLHWLREQETVAVPALAASGDSSEPGYLGCKIVEWRGHRVSLICMKRDDGQSEMPNLHLFTIDAAAIAGLDRDEIIAHLPETEQSSRKWSTAVWQSGDRVYLVFAAGRHMDPRNLVPLG